MGKLLRARQVAERLDVATSTVFAWAAQGLIPHCRLGTAVRFPESEIEEWIKSNIRGGEREPAEAGQRGAA